MRLWAHPCSNRFGAERPRRKATEGGRWTRPEDPSRPPAERPKPGTGYTPLPWPYSHGWKVGNTLYVAGQGGAGTRELRLYRAGRRRGAGPTGLEEAAQQFAEAGWGKYRRLRVSTYRRTSATSRPSIGPLGVLSPTATIPSRRDGRGRKAWPPGPCSSNCVMAVIGALTMIRVVAPQCACRARATTISTSTRTCRPCAGIMFATSGTAVKPAGRRRRSASPTSSQVGRVLTTSEAPPACDRTPERWRPFADVPNPPPAAFSIMIW